MIKEEIDIADLVHIERIAQVNLKRQNKKYFILYLVSAWTDDYHEAFLRKEIQRYREIA